MLGKFEEEVLLAALQAGDASMTRDIHSRLLIGDQQPAFGAVYTTLTRMVSKGLVRQSFKIAGGRPRTAFTVSEAGLAALKSNMSRFLTLGGLALIR